MLLATSNRFFLFRKCRGKAELTFLQKSFKLCPATLKRAFVSRKSRWSYTPAQVGQGAIFNLVIFIRQDKMTPYLEVFLWAT